MLPGLSSNPSTRLKLAITFPPEQGYYTMDWLNVSIFAVKVVCIFLVEYNTLMSENTQSQSSIEQGKLEVEEARLNKTVTSLIGFVRRNGKDGVVSLRRPEENSRYTYQISEDDKNLNLFIDKTKDTFMVQMTKTGGVSQRVSSVSIIGGSEKGVDDRFVYVDGNPTMDSVQAARELLQDPSMMINSYENGHAELESDTGQSVDKDRITRYYDLLEQISGQRMDNRIGK